MNYLVYIVFVLAGGISIYAIIVALLAFRAIKQRRYEAYKRKQDDFNRLDQEVIEAFRNK